MTPSKDQRARVCAEQRGEFKGGAEPPPCRASALLPLAAPEARNFENFGRNSRYLRIPGNRLCPRAKRGRPASAATPKAQITDFAEVSPGFYYRPQRIMDSVPFCGFACPTLHPRKLCVFSFFLEFTKTLLLYVRIQYCADLSSVTQLQYCLHQLLLTT